MSVEPASRDPFDIEDALANLDSSTLPDPLRKLVNRGPRLARVIQFLWRLGERWGMDRCSLTAAAMAFFGLLSLFPIMLAGISIIGKLLAGQPKQVEHFVAFAATFFPGATGQVLQDRVQSEIASIASSPNGVTIGLFSFVSLMWSGRAYFDTLAYVLNTIWPHAQPRLWWQHQLALWSTFIGAGLLYILSLAVTFLIGLARTFSDRLPDLFINRQPILWNIIAVLSSWLLTLWMFWMIYRFLPNATASGRGARAFGSALIATGGFEIAKYVFTQYVPDATRYGAVYGSVASVVLMMMWLYLTSSIVLLGAEAAAAYAEVEALAMGAPKPTRDKAEDKGEALGAPPSVEAPAKHG